MGRKARGEKCAPVEPTFVCDPPPWATRIPAAIKRAEDWVEDHKGWSFIPITATEVALAEALWEQMQGDEYRRHPANPEAVPPPALIAFMEKVEALDVS